MYRVRVRNKRGRAIQLYYVDPLTGKERTRSSGTRKRREAERAAQRWEAELNELGATNALSWDAFRLRYEDEHLAAKSKNTRGNAAKAMNQFEAALNGSPRRLEAITSSTISQVSATWRKWGLSDGSIGAYLGHLRAAFGWGARTGIVRQVPHFPMPSMNGRHMRGRPITLGECKRILGATRTEQPRSWRHWVRFQRGLWLSGLRLSEAMILSWDSGRIRVDLDGNRYPALRIHRKGQKSRKDEVMPITPDFVAWLRRTPEGQRTGPVLPLLSTIGGRPIRCPKRVGRVLSDIGKAAGVLVDDETGKHASAHDFRRAFGTRWAAKVKPVTLQRLMRHKDIRTTLAYYVDQDADDVAGELWSETWSG